MSSVSASIIVLAGAVLLTGGSHVQHGDTQIFLQAVGGLVGLVGWFIAFKDSLDK